MNKPALSLVRHCLCLLSLFAVLGLIPSGAAAAASDRPQPLPVSLDTLLAYQARMDYEQIEAARSQLEALDGDAVAADREDELTLLLTVVYAFLMDYYDFVRDDQRESRRFTDKTIETAERALALDDEPVLLYSLLAAGYSRRMTGPLSALRFGGRLNDAIDGAAERDPEHESYLYLQARQYLLAPRAFGGDREAALAGFVELTERYPDNTWYWTFAALSYLEQDSSPETKAQAVAALQEAIAIAPANAWAARTLESLDGH